MELRPGEVHLWAIDLARPRGQADQLCSLLSADELRRAGGMRIESARRHFLVARGALRSLLARYLDTPASELPLVARAGAKPALAGSTVRFNLSHSGELAIVALAREREVGVDVELIRRRRDPAALATRYLAPNEARVVRDAGDRTASFYRHWVAKEALLKATGTGLAGGPRALEVALEPVPRILASGADAGAGSRWSLELFDVPARYTAALVTEGALRRTPLRAFDPLAG